MELILRFAYYVTFSFLFFEGNYSFTACLEFLVLSSFFSNQKENSAYLYLSFLLEPNVFSRTVLPYLLMINFYIYIYFLCSCFFIYSHLFVLKRNKITGKLQILVDCFSFSTVTVSSGAFTRTCSLYYIG